MKKLAFLLIIATLVAATFPAMVSAHTEDDPAIRKLIAGQTTHAGWVLIWNDGVNLHVKYTAWLGFCLNETHLHVATDLADIPKNKGGPIPGHFDYKDDDLGCVPNMEYVIPLDGWVAGTDLFVVAHAVVGRVDDPDYEETGWGVWCGHVDDFQIDTRNWATYMEYTVQ